MISSIIHITHKYDNDDEPWPIEIEDHNGVMHAVNLEPGQMLFYESAVCLHGRRKTLKGQYYGSLFVHYQPIDVHIWNYTIEVRKYLDGWIHGWMDERNDCIDL